MFQRWKSEPDLVFQELMYARASVVSASEDDLGNDDPQIAWLIPTTSNIDSCDRKLRWFWLGTIGDLVPVPRANCNKAQNLWKSGLWWPIFAFRTLLRFLNDNPYRSAKRALSADKYGPSHGSILLVVGIRRYPEQREHWLNIWKNRYQLVENSMIKLREQSFSLGRAAAMESHIAWLFSSEITNGAGIPFYREAGLFRQHYDQLIEGCDQKMAAAGHNPVKHQESSE